MEFGRVKAPGLGPFSGAGGVGECCPISPRPPHLLHPPHQADSSFREGAWSLTSAAHTHHSAASEWHSIRSSRVREPKTMCSVARLMWPAERRLRSFMWYFRPSVVWLQPPYLLSPPCPQGWAYRQVLHHLPHFPMMLCS